MTLTTEDLLDLAPSIGQRSSTFRYDLLDATGATIGSVTPESSQVPTITNDSTRAIKRDLRGFVLSPTDEAAVNPVSDRIAPSMVLQNGDVLPWGRFVFVDGSRAPQTAGTWFRGAMLDQGFILDQALPTSIGYGEGASIRAALLALFADVGLADAFVDTFSNTVAKPIAWPAGTSRLVVMNELAAMAGCYSVFFDNTGQARVELVPDLAVVPADRTYPLGGNIYNGSVLITDNILTSPNRYVVIDSSATDAPIVGVYDVPASAPHSFANRGFYVARVITEQGLGTQAAAEARGAAAAAQDAADFTWVSFSSAPDPRHDTFDVVELLGVRYREQRWSCPLQEGAVMAHDLRGIYT